MSVLDVESTTPDPPTQEALAARCVWLMAGDVPVSPTLTTLLGYCFKNGIPPTARIEYAACGSHAIAVTWDQP